MKAQIKLASLAENRYFFSRQFEKDLAAMLKPLSNNGAQS